MEQLPNGYTLHIPTGCFPLSTDSMVLAHFAKLPKNARVLDLGSGCGTLGLLLCAKDDRCHVTGMELTEAAHTAALDNIQRNRLQSRLASICSPLQSVSERFSPGQFDVCISNPPYFSGGPASSTLPTARREDHCTVDDWMQAAAWCLKFGGDFFLVHRPERLAELIAAAAKYNLEAKRLCLLRHKPTAGVNLFFCSCAKAASRALSGRKSPSTTPMAFQRPFIKKFIIFHKRLSFRVERSGTEESSHCRVESNLTEAAACRFMAAKIPRLRSG